MTNEMMYTVATWHSEIFGNIRTATETNGTAWLFGSDVANAMGYAKPRNAIQSLVREKNKRTARRKNFTAVQVGGESSFSDNRGAQFVVLIDEPGLYSLLRRSTMDKADEFFDWVCNTILPAARAHGVHDPAGIFADLNKAAIKLAKKIEADEPLIRYAETVTAMGKPGARTIAEFAQMLADDGFPVGPQRLRDWLIYNRYLNPTVDPVRPYQKYIGNVFAVSNDIHCDGKKTVFTIYILPEGQMEIFEKLRSFYQDARQRDHEEVRGLVRDDNEDPRNKDGFIVLQETERFHETMKQMKLKARL